MYSRLHGIAMGHGVNLHRLKDIMQEAVLLNRSSKENQRLASLRYNFG